MRYDGRKAKRQERDVRFSLRRPPSARQCELADSVRFPEEKCVFACDAIPLADWVMANPPLAKSGSRWPGGRWNATPCGITSFNATTWPPGHGWGVPQGTGRGGGQ